MTPARTSCVLAALAVWSGCSSATSTGDGGAPDAAATSPGTGSESGSGGGRSRDSGILDAGACTGTCCPTAIPASFTGVVHPSAGNTSCTSSSLDALVTDCAHDAGACGPDEQSACGRCVLTLASAEAWGAFLFLADGAVQYPFGNPGGCILATDHTAAGAACGLALQTVVECELSVCTATHCPVRVDAKGKATDPSQVAAYVGSFDTNGKLVTAGCIELADESVCAPYVDAVATECAGPAETKAANACAAAQSASTVRAQEAEYATFCGGA